MHICSCASFHAKIVNRYTTSMFYYEVLVATQAYHGNEALTYSSEVSLPVGSVVKVSLRTRQVLGLVLRR